MGMSSLMFFETNTRMSLVFMPPASEENLERATELSNPKGRDKSPMAMEHEGRVMISNRAQNRDLGTRDLGMVANCQSSPSPGWPSLVGLVRIGGCESSEYCACLRILLDADLAGSVYLRCVVVGVEQSDVDSGDRVELPVRQPHSQVESVALRGVLIVQWLKRPPINFVYIVDKNRLFFSNNLRGTLWLTRIINRINCKS